MNSKYKKHLINFLILAVCLFTLFLSIFFSFYVWDYSSTVCKAGIATARGLFWAGIFIPFFIFAILLISITCWVIKQLFKIEFIKSFFVITVSLSVLMNIGSVCWNLYYLMQVSYVKEDCSYDFLSGEIVKATLRFPEVFVRALPEILKMHTEIY